MTPLSLVVFRKLSGGVGSFARHLQRQTGGRLIRVSSGNLRKDDECEWLRIKDIPEPVLALETPEEKNIDLGLFLFRNKSCSVVVHDPRHLEGKRQDVLPLAKKVIVIRPGNRKLWSESVFIPHPYVRQFTDFEARGLRSQLACAHTRIDFDKQTHLIVEANRKLPEEMRVDIYGKTNRAYAFWKKIDDEIIGRFDGSGAALCRNYIYDVDLTIIKDDGGGTQYSFLEAADAGTVPILWESWGMKDHCVGVSSSADLVHFLSGRKPERNEIVDRNLALLRKHADVSQQYLDLLR